MLAIIEGILLHKLGVLPDPSQDVKLYRYLASLSASILQFCLLSPCAPYNWSGSHKEPALTFLRVSLSSSFFNFLDI